jgi:hypothetical protein
MMSLSPSCEVAATVLARRPGPRTVLGSGLLCFGPGCANQPVCVCELVTGCVWIGGQRPLVGQGEDQLGASLAFGLGGLFQSGLAGAFHLDPVSGGGPLGQLFVGGPRCGRLVAGEGLSGLVPPAACFCPGRRGRFPDRVAAFDPERFSIRSDGGGPVGPFHPAHRTRRQRTQRGSPGRRVQRCWFAQLDDPAVHSLSDLSHCRRVRTVAQVPGGERRTQLAVALRRGGRALQAVVKHRREVHGVVETPNIERSP